MEKNLTFAMNLEIILHMEVPTLKKHMVLHAGEKMCTCDPCGNSFSCKKSFIESHETAYGTQTLFSQQISSTQIF